MMSCPDRRKQGRFKASRGFGPFFTILLTFGFWLLANPLYPLRSSAQTTRPDTLDKPIHDAFEATNIIPVSCEVEDGMVSEDVCRFFTNALYVKLGKHITVQAFDDPGEDAARKGVLGAFGSSGKISFFMSQRLGTYVVLRLLEIGSPDATRLYVGGTAYDPSGPTIRQQSAIQGMQNLCVVEGGTGPACDAVKQEESKVSQQPNHQLPVWSAKEGIGRDTGPTEAEKAAAASQLAGDFAAYWYKVLKTALPSGNSSSQALTQSPLGTAGPNAQSSTGIASVLKAAENGDAEAQDRLGLLYSNGQGLTQNYVQAVYWWRKAAQQGNVKAEYNLGLSYQNGQGVMLDHAQAANWFRKGADQDYAPAENGLGVLYYLGQGVGRDYAQSVYWWKKAAEQGDADSQYKLAALYVAGQGVSQNYAQAYFWLDLAATRKAEVIKQEDVRELRDEAASHLTPAELSEVQERARKWIDEHRSTAAPSPKQ